MGLRSSLLALRAPLLSKKTAQRGLRALQKFYRTNGMLLPISASLLFLEYDATLPRLVSISIDTMTRVAQLKSGHNPQCRTKRSGLLSTTKRIKKIAGLTSLFTKIDSSDRPNGSFYQNRAHFGPGEELRETAETVFSSKCGTKLNIDIFTILAPAFDHIRCTRYDALLFERGDSRGILCPLQRT